MKIAATIDSKKDVHLSTVETNGIVQSLQLSSKPSGFGSSVNGGEMLMLALATCFCNDIYREAARRQIHVTGVQVTVSSQFGAEGEAGTDIIYQARVEADASPDEIDLLIKYVDGIAEIHNTLRKGTSVTLQRD